MDNSKPLSLTPLLKKDMPAIKEIRTLFNREEKYRSFLGAIEHAVAEHYIEHRDTTDKQVTSTIKHLERTYMHDLDSFSDRLPMRILAYLGLALEEMPVTHHELKLVFSYIRWSIDNRNWMPGKQAYVRWIANALDFFDEKEKEAYEHEMRTLARRRGIPKSAVDAAILMKGTEVDVPEDDGFSQLNSEFFAIPEREKFDTVIDHLQERPELLGFYVDELEAHQDYETMERLFKSVLDIAPCFQPITMKLGLLYKRKGNPHLARHHFEQALESLKEIPDEVIDASQKEHLWKTIKEGLEGI